MSIPSFEGSPGRPVVVAGGGFDISVTAATTTYATPYTAGDIMGGLLTFDIGGELGGVFFIQDIQVIIKDAVTPNLRVVLFSADPTNTTKTDNAAYSLAAADAFLVKKTVSLNNWTSHATAVKEASTGNIGDPIKKASLSTTIYALLIDDTGVTLTSATSVQVSLRGLF